MKIRNTIFAIFSAALLLLCPSITRAAFAPVVVGTTTNFSKVTISLTISTNGVSTTNNNTITLPIGKVKTANAGLLAMFATWTTNSLTVWQSAGAQLEFDWDSYQLVVADKSGTNVLFYAGTGINNGTITAYFTLDWFNAYGPYASTYVGTVPGSQSWTGYSTAYFELSYTDSSTATPNQDILCYGPDVEKFKQSWNNNGASWTDTESFTVNYCGGIFNNAQYSQVTGTISANGKGNDFNPVLDPQ